MFTQRMTQHFSLNANYTLSWAYSYDARRRLFPQLSEAFDQPVRQL